MARESISRRNKGDGRFVFTGHGHGASVRSKCLALDAIHQGAAIERRYGDSKSRLRQSVNGKLRFAAEAVTREALGKTIERFRIHWLGAIQRRAPGAEVDALDIFVR